MGELVVHVGPSGHGEMIKLINNTLAAINAAALAEALVLAQTAELDTDELRQVVAAGIGRVDDARRSRRGRCSSAISSRCSSSSTCSRTCATASREAEALGVDLPLAELAESLYSQAAENGLGSRRFRRR